MTWRRVEPPKPEKPKRKPPADGTCTRQSRFGHEFIPLGSDHGWQRDDGATCMTMACTHCADTRAVVVRPADAREVRRMGFGASVPTVPDEPQLEWSGPSVRKTR